MKRIKTFAQFRKTIEELDNEYDNVKNMAKRQKELKTKHSKSHK